MLAATINTLTPRMRFKLHQPKIENFVFQLHYKATVTLLLAFVILVCAREYFGEHIKCISDQGIPNHVIQTYCFFMATFTIVRHYNESLLQGEFLPHPGVGPMMESDEKLHHTYYQWVPFVLFLQSICFYLPHYVWKKKEGGRIKALVNGLQFASLALQEEGMKIAEMEVPSKQGLNDRLEAIRNNIILRLKISNTWSTWLVALEVANLLHVMLQIWLIDRFLNGNFLHLGPWVLSVTDWDQIADPLETVFPKVTKCLFHKYGPSGSIQQHDALCIMALNVVHEKIYTVLWFWLMFLLIASILAVIWRLITFFLYRRSFRFNAFLFRQVSGNKFNPYNLLRVLNGCQFGDWLFLYYLAKNMEGFVFQELFVRLAEELDKRSNPYPVVSQSPKEEEEKDDHDVKDELDEKDIDPLLIAKLAFDDETISLNDEKKLS